jgi:hypothetical protein
MKKIITILVASVLVLTSCSKEELPTPNQVNVVVQTPEVTPNPPANIPDLGAPTEAEFAALPQWTNIPDNVMEQVLIDRGFDNILDGKVLTSKISKITGFDSNDGTIMGQYGRMFERKDIHDFTGIENFISLQFISFWKCPISTVNIRNLKRLKILGMSECPITGTIDISQNTQLEEIGFQNAAERCDDPTYPFGKTLGLTSIDVSHNLKLKRIYLACNRITSIDVSMLTNLEEIYLGGSAWQSYKVGGGNPIQRLDLSRNTKIRVVNVEACNLNYLNVKNNGILDRCITIYNPNLNQILVDNASAMNAAAQNNPVTYRKDAHSVFVQ